jgi:DNA-binding transcriptional LysR family regulator
LEAVPLLGLSVAQLQDTSVDFAIGPIPTASGPYVRQKLYADKFVCIVNASSPVAKGAFTMDAYVSARHLQLGLMDSEAPTQVEAALKRIGIKRNIVLRTHSLAAAFFILADTDLILTIPLRVAERFTSIAHLKIFDLPAEMEELVVYQLWHERNKDDARHKWFRTQMKEAVSIRDKNRRPKIGASV